MFYYLGKVGWHLLQPSALLLLLLVAAAVALRWGRTRLGRRLLLAAVVFLLVGGLLPLSTWLLLPLEQRFARPDLAAGAPLTGIVVLGGAEEARIWKRRHAHAMSEGGERFTEAAGLARRFPQARVVFSGGSNVILGAEAVGAEAAQVMLTDLGAAEGGRLLLERAARTTWENAVNTRALVRPQPGERWLLVTSAWHMPRAMGAFRRAGFPVDPWPVDYRTASTDDALVPFPSPADGLKRLDVAGREWLGLVAYRLTGRTDALFPGPVTDR